MGTLYMVNAPKRKSRKRRTAAQKRATAKMIAANKAKRRGKVARRKTVKRRARRTASPTTRKRRTTRRATTMARKRGRKRATARRRTSTRRRRSSGARRRSPVTRLRRNSVYLTNPRRRRRRARYGRNPSIVSQIKQGVMDAGATLAGGAAARTVSGMLPLPKDGVAGAASGLAVALAVGILARKVVSSDTARFITAGAMQVPVKNLITTFVPGAGAFLGDYDSMGAYALPTGVGNYLSPGMYGVPESQEDIGIYEN